MSGDPLEALILALPAGTRFYDVDGTPVATLPGDPPRRYDRDPATFHDPSDVLENGVETTRQDFLALVRATRARP